MADAASKEVGCWVVAGKKRCGCRHPLWHVTHRLAATTPQDSGIHVVPDDASRGTMKCRPTTLAAFWVAGSLLAGLWLWPAASASDRERRLVRVSRLYVINFALVSSLSSK